MFKSCSEITTELLTEKQTEHGKGVHFFIPVHSVLLKGSPVQLIFGPYELYWSSFSRCRIFFHVLSWDYSYCTSWKMSGKLSPILLSVLFLIPQIDLDSVFPFVL